MWAINRFAGSSVVFQNEYGVFEVKLYGFELAEDVESNEAVCVVEFEVPHNCALTKCASLFSHVRVSDSEIDREAEGRHTPFRHIDRDFRNCNWCWNDLRPKGRESRAGVYK